MSIELVMPSNVSSPEAPFPPALNLSRIMNLPANSGDVTGRFNHCKNDRMISVRFQGKPFNITVIQAYAPTSNADEAEVEQFYEDLQPGRH